MTDHFLEARKQLTDVDDLRTELVDEYSTKKRPAVISQVHQDIGAAFKSAEIHAQLAIAQGLQDLRATIEVGRL